MILLFCLQRPEILSYNDLAIQWGLRMVYHHRQITKELFAKYKRRFSPCGSVASLYLWAIACGAVEGMRITKNKLQKLNRPAAIHQSQNVFSRIINELKKIMNKNQETKQLHTALYTATAILAVLAMVFAALDYRKPNPLCQTLAITFFTTFYHFFIRFFVSTITYLPLRNSAKKNSRKSCTPKSACRNGKNICQPITHRNLTCATARRRKSLRKPAVPKSTIC